MPFRKVNDTSPITSTWKELIKFKMARLYVQKALFRYIVYIVVSVFTRKIVDYNSHRIYSIATLYPDTSRELFTTDTNDKRTQVFFLMLLIKMSTTNTIQIHYNTIHELVT